MTYFKFVIYDIVVKAGNPGNIWDRKYYWIPIAKRLDYEWRQGIGFYFGVFAFEIHQNKMTVGHGA